jgi:hypothetical protein
MPFEPTRADFQDRLRRVSGKLVDEYVRYRADFHAPGREDGDVINVFGSGTVVSVSVGQVVFERGHERVTVPFSNLRAIRISAQDTVAAQRLVT